MIKQNQIITSVSREVKTATVTRKETRMVGLSYCPSYSVKQLRRINGLQIKKAKYGHRNAIAKTFAVREQLLTKNALDQEAIL